VALLGSFGLVLHHGARIRAAAERTSVRCAHARCSASTESVLLDRALLLTKACSLAFLPESAITSSPYAKGFKCLAQVEDPESLSGATVFTVGDDIVIACRGSANLRNFRTNFALGPVALQTASGPHPSARVHDGFQRASRELWKLIQPSLPPTGRVLMTGHSLGGGTATLLALHAGAAGREVDLLTVAGPRLGNGAFGQHFREVTGAAPTHLMHDDDEVLKSNVDLWDRVGFEHVGTVVRCDQDLPCLYEDDEQICLAETAIPPDKVSLKGILVDHCQYMGVYIGVRAEHPSVWLRPPW